LVPRKIPERAFDADDDLTDAAKRFIDRHVTAGGKRPPAPALRRETDTVARKARA